MGAFQANYPPEETAIIAAWDAGWSARGKAQRWMNPYPPSRIGERMAWDSAYTYRNWSNPIEIVPKPRDRLL